MVQDCSECTTGGLRGEIGERVLSLSDCMVRLWIAVAKRFHVLN